MRLIKTLTIIIICTLQSFCQEFKFLRAFGTKGVEYGKLDQPYGVALDKSENVYVADYGNHRVDKFDSTGNYIKSWGPYGTFGGQFSNGEGIAVSDSGIVYVTDYFDCSVYVFDTEGNKIAKWGNSSTQQGNGYFYHTFGVAIDRSYNVYVADGNQIIQKFSSTGKFIRRWGFYGDTYPFDFGQLDAAPEGIAVDHVGNVYVTNGRRKPDIIKFDSTGKFLFRIKSNGALGSLTYPRWLTTDGVGNLYVSDYENHVVKKYDQNGNFITSFGGKGSGDGQFNYVNGLAIGKSGKIYVADAGNNRIQVFGKKGTTGFDSEEAEQSTLKISPNPSSSGIFTIATEGQVYITLRNMEQAILLSKEISSNSKIELSNYPKGVYFLETQSTKGSTIKKLIIN
jgi:hypothetical protein